MRGEQDTRWERRDTKRAAARRRMRVNGRGLITVNLTLEQKRERERRAKDEYCDDSRGSAGAARRILRDLADHIFGGEPSGRASA